MINREFLRAGHPPTLFAACFSLDISFLVWVLLGPLGSQIARAVHLGAAQKALMVAAPIPGNGQAGLLIFAVLALVAVVGLAGITRRWRTNWCARPGVARL